MKHVFRILTLVLLWIATEVWLLDKLVLMDHVRIELFIITVVFFAIHNGVLAGTLMGFVLGLLQDTTLTASLGAGTLAKTILGYSFGRTKDQLMTTSILTQCLIAFSAVVAHNLLYAFFLWLRDGFGQGLWHLRPEVKEMLLAFTVQNGIYTALVTPILLGITYLILHLSLRIER